MRNRIHDLLERKIAMRDMQGGYRRKRRTKVTGDRKIISPTTGKLVSYKKHMQGKRLARLYGFRKGSKAPKRRGRKRMTGRGFGYGCGMDEQDDIYGYGYVPELYGPDGPDPKYRYEYCYKGMLGPQSDNGLVFYNPYTGKCEKSITGQKLQRERAKFAEKEAHKVATANAPLSRAEQREIEAYNHIMSEQKKGTYRHVPRTINDRLLDAEIEKENLLEILQHATAGAFSPERIAAIKKKLGIL